MRRRFSQEFQPQIFAENRRFSQKPVCSEKNKGGWKTQGRGKHTVKPLPKNGFGPPPPTYDTFLPPPFAHAMSFSFEGTGTDQTNPTFGALQNRFLEGTHMVRFPPPKSHDTFPPICRFPICPISISLENFSLNVLISPHKN